MTGYIVRYDGTVLKLPTILEWKFEYGVSTPCDSFEMTVLWESGDVSDLSAAVEFWAEENGERVFTGVVDEFSLRMDASGRRAELAGRGMAALLLDNEAEAADYGTATWADVLRRHVTPYGISAVGTAPPPASGFSVAYGSSEWQAVYEFARYWGGTVPRFDRQGRLVTGPWDDGMVKLLDDKAAVTGMRWREKRYGVLSQVLVRDKVRQTVQTVTDEAFLAQGGRCRRWYTMPGRSSYQAMRYRGQYQLEQSGMERYRLEITVPKALFAYPGELVRVDRHDWACNGLYRVARASTGTDSQGEYTTLALSKPNMVG